MKCQILFSGENMANLSSVELAQRVVKVELFTRFNCIFTLVLP